MNGAAVAAIPSADNQVALRLCQAEIQAVLEKFGMQMGVKRVETQIAGETTMEYLIIFAPRGSARPGAGLVNGERKG